MQEQFNPTHLELPPVSADNPIDRRVKLLVAVLNVIPGVYTTSSCGGHRRKISRVSLPSGRFNVNIGIYRKRDTAGIVRLLVTACDTFWPEITLSPWLNGNEVDWDLSGRRIHPDLLASNLMHELGFCR